MKKIILTLGVIFFWLTSPALAYDTASSSTGSISKTGAKKPVHQKLTKEAIKFWNDAPPEAKNEFLLYSSRDIYGKTDPVGLVDFDAVNSGYLGKIKADDLISGSTEEDNVKSPADFNELCSGDGLNGFFEHFWDPDIPWQVGFNCNSGDGLIYNFGLPKVKELNVNILYTPNSYLTIYYDPGVRTYDSAYRLAKFIWDDKILPNKAAYQSGDPVVKREMYYWLGRIAHLLQDQTVPAHVHTRYHDPVINRGKDYFESYANKVIDRYVYSDAQYAGQYYKYENLIEGFPWGDLISGGADPNDLFKLFWYTAQKTQYFASNTPAAPGIDRVKGNDFYRDWYYLDPRITFNPSLWAQENITPVSDPNLVAANLDPISDALIPHALKATAGLYRLFWDTMNPPANPDYLAPAQADSEINNY